MGQYHLTVNLDKREFISAHKLASGLKLWEQLAGDIGPGKALIVLLAHPAHRGGGDFTVGGTDDEAYNALSLATIGRWRGDRIAIVGDYAEDGDIPGIMSDEAPAGSIYDLCREDYECDPEQPLEARQFALVLTGFPIPDVSKLEYIGTCQNPEGDLVIHLYEVAK